MDDAGDRCLRLGREYDIRETDEDLYLAVLAARLAENDRAAGDLSGSGAKAEGTTRDD